MLSCSVRSRYGFLVLFAHIDNFIALVIGRATRAKCLVGVIKSKGDLLAPWRSEGFQHDVALPWRMGFLRKKNYRSFSVRWAILSRGSTCRSARAGRLVNLERSLQSPGLAIRLISDRRDR